MISRRTMGIVRRIAYEEKHMELSPEAVAQARRFFFESMRRALSFESGWSGSPKHKIFFHQEGSLQLEGQYWISSNNSAPTVRLSGATIITFRGTKIWNMNLLGTCRRRDLPFLRHVLFETYRRREFVGGRGPAHYERRRQAYENRTSPGRFEGFCGIEKVRRVPPHGSAISSVTTLITYSGGLIAPV